MVDSLIRLQYEASDPTAATAAARSVLGSAEVTAGTTAMAWNQDSLVDDGITISSIQSAGDTVRLALSRSAELLVLHVRSGSVRLVSGDFDLVLQPKQLGLVNIGDDADITWKRAHFEVFSIPATPIARLLGVSRDAVRLRAPRADPCSEALANYFRQATEMLTGGVFRAPEVYASDLVRSQAIDTLTAITVEAFDLTNESEHDTSRDITIIRRSIAEMRAHLAEPISIPEIAHAAGVSVRGLQVVFRRQLDASPLMHLRQMRLEEARARLVDEARTGTTIAEVARQYGYANSGRFSTHFRDEFGESPADTLQRIRSAGPSPDEQAPHGGAAKKQSIT